MVCGPPRRTTASPPRTEPAAADLRTHERLRARRLWEVQKSWESGELTHIIFDGWADHRILSIELFNQEVSFDKKSISNAELVSVRPSQGRGTIAELKLVPIEYLHTCYPPRCKQAGLLFVEYVSSPRVEQRPRIRCRERVPPSPLHHHHRTRHHRSHHHRCRLQPRLRPRARNPRRHLPFRRLGRHHPRHHLRRRLDRERHRSKPRCARSTRPQGWPSRSVRLPRLALACAMRGSGSSPMKRPRASARCFTIVMIPPIP